MLYTTHSNDWIDAAKRWYKCTKEWVKKTEFSYMLEGKLYWGAELLQKSQKYDKIAGLISKLRYEY